MGALIFKWVLIALLSPVLALAWVIDNVASFIDGR